MMRILHVFSILDVGGMESYVMNMYRCIDRSKVQFDFLVHHARRGVFEDEIESLGGRIYHATVLDDFNLLKYQKQLNTLFREQDYQVVHGHLSSMALWYLGAAERAGVKHRILHCHCPGQTKTLKGYLRHFLFRFSPRHANIRFACSREAGVYQFKKQTFEVLPNGIDVLRFCYSEEKRAEVRARLNLGDDFVIGHVGRFFPEKNHGFILEAFGALLKKLPTAKLLLLGDGPLMGSIRQKAKEMGIGHAVFFMGLQKDCTPFYSAMDCFILPSVYEGLPLSGIEAQCAGLPCIFTAAASLELKISREAEFLPVGEGDAGKWADRMEVISRQKTERSHLPEEAARYDVNQNAIKMMERYLVMGAKEI